MENNEIRRFDLSIFLHNFRLALKRLFWLPLLLALVLGAFGYWRRARSYRPEYGAKMVYLVSSNYVSTIDISSYSSHYDSNAASRLSASFPHILATDAAQQMIYQRLGRYTLPATVTGESMADSSIFTLTSRGDSPEAAKTALEVVVEVFPSAAANILGNVTMDPIEKDQEIEVSGTPLEPFAPTGTVVKYALLGLAAGLVLIGLSAWLRRTVHTEEDLKQLVSTPCLGTLPQVRFKARTKANRNVLLTNPKVGDAYIEAVNTLRFNLRKELERQSAQVIMVTSTGPSEGKTSVSANLALSLASQGSRVILLDADLRKPEQKKLFGIETPGDGLAELIAGKSEKISPLTVPDSSLLLISGDKAADHPQRFLESPRLKKILNSLREQMDYVILDTPPSGILADAATLAQQVDGVIYVVRQDYVKRNAIADSMQMLAATDVRFLGCVLSDAERSTTKYGYGYRGGYSSKYGGYYGSKYSGYYGKKYYGKSSDKSGDGYVK